MLFWYGQGATSQSWIVVSMDIPDTGNPPGPGIESEPRDADAIDVFNALADTKGEAALIQWLAWFTWD